MKKTSIILALFALLGGSLYAQNRDNVARECVLFELFTGVRCPYCPAAANAVAQLLEEGKAIAPVAYHTSAFSTADYYTTETNARANFYGITAYPTLKADGLFMYEGGGSASETNYAPYLSRYNQRINQASPFTIDLSCDPGADGQWTVHCTVNQVGECSATNVKVMIALTQCNINVAWMGMNGLHHVCRDLIPSQQGTTFVGPAMTFDYPFEMNWPKQDCYLTAWVQNFSGNKEVYQAVRLSLDLNLDYDLVMEDVKYYSTTNCSGMIRPTVNVSSFSNEEINSFQIVALADGIEMHRETWNGSLLKGENVDFQLSEFEIGNCSELHLKVVDPNGHEDEYEADNDLLVAMEDVHTIDGYLKMQVKADQKPEENIIQIIEVATGEIVYEFHFDTPGHVYQEDLNVLNAGCYRIKILDTGGDGVTTGLFRFSDSAGNLLVKVNNTTDFTNEYTYEFYCDGTISVEETEAEETVLYPNPSKGKFFLSLEEGEWRVEVYDITGRQVFGANKFAQGDVELVGCEEGVYFLKASNGVREIVRKVMIY